MDWTAYYPAFVHQHDDNSDETPSTDTATMAKEVEVADIGCGFGGLLVALSPILPNTLMLGWSHPFPEPTSSSMSMAWVID